MKTFKHSGTFGDLIYGLSVMKHLGGGKFYVHKNRINWIAKFYYNAVPNPVHEGRMTQADADSLRDFLLDQEYITAFDSSDDPDLTVDYDLDSFRKSFVHHPGSYLSMYSDAFGLPPDEKKIVCSSSWLTCSSPNRVAPVVINRTERWLPPQLSEFWNDLRDQGLEQESVFVGTPREYELFKQNVGWHGIEYHRTDNVNELARVVAGADAFIGNQSMALSIAAGLGKPFHCEVRRDLPLDRNECYFADLSWGSYF